MRIDTPIRNWTIKVHFYYMNLASGDYLYLKNGYTGNTYNGAFTGSVVPGDVITNPANGQGDSLIVQFTTNSFGPNGA